MNSLASSRWLPLPVIALLVALCAPPAAAQRSPASWTARLEPADARAGEGAQVVVTAKVEAPWHLYSTTKLKGVGPVTTTIELVLGKALTAPGTPVQPEPHKEMDAGFGIETESYAGEVAFGLPVKLAAGISGPQKAVVKVKFQVCKEGLCMPPKTVEVPVEFIVSPGSARPERAQPVTKVPKQPAGYQAPNKEKAGAPPPAIGSTQAGSPGTGSGDVSTQIKTAQQGGLLPFLLLAVSMGFLALLTPCVFPMIPITVSFFSKQGEGQTRSVMPAVSYCLGIIGTFTGLGLFTTLLFGATGISNLATNPWVNLCLGVLFVVLAFNLFGAFEIIVPGWLLEQTQSRSQAGKLVGPLFMGLTFSLTSFTCTVPFVGGILATASQGNLVWPLVGMLGFSAAFASPFFVLALFPQWLAGMPKAGGWLVTVKAFMGFVELAAALKFLSNVDLVLGTRLMSREVFVSLWSTITLVAAAYMLGCLRLPHSPPGQAIGSFRRLIGIATLVGAVFCLRAVNGASLGELNAFLPPPSTNGEIPWIRNWDQAVAQAKSEQKLLFVNFTGVTCTNCRLMEQNIFPKPEVVSEARNFVPVELFTDRADAESARYKRLEQEMLGTVALPVYAVVTPEGKVLTRFEGMTRSASQFAGFLKQGRAAAPEMASGG